MQLATIFQFSMYTLACLASVMLGLTEHQAIPQGITVPLALLAFFFNERWNLFRLSGMWSNVLGLLAFGAAAGELMMGSIEARVLSGAHLLAYLNWIIFFQEQRPKKYWMMCALGVLQVAVGTVLSDAGWYGVLLILYLFGAIWTLSVFSLYEGLSRFAQDHPLSAPRLVNQTASGSDSNDQRRAGRRPAVGRLSLGAALRRESVVRKTVHHDPHERWIGVRFALGTLVMACLSMGIALVFFLLIPRVWIGERQVLTSGSVEGGRSLSGFTEEVRLGEIGEILESTEPVMEIRLVDPETGEELDVPNYTSQLGYEEPLFRGTVLGTYENGHWKSGRHRKRGRLLFSRPRTPENTVRQEIRLEPIDTRLLFAIPPVRAVHIGRKHRVHINAVDSVLIRPESKDSDEPVSYQVFSAKPAQRREFSRPALPSFSTRSERGRYLDLPTDGLDRLKRLARQVAGADVSSEKPPPLVMAERLERFLRDSGEYGYSLDSRIQDPQVDPVEDFLFNRKTGHCEYYASALTLMLRSVNIPARMVSGFKGGTPNRLTGAFEVEQRHAHTWVEARIGSRWLVFDATPSEARSQSVESMTVRFQSWHELTRVFSDLWNRGVIGLTLAQQRRSLYTPLGSAAKDWFRAVREGRFRFSAVVRTLKDFLSSPERWISWQGGVGTFVLLLVSAAFVWSTRKCWTLAVRMWSYLQQRRLDTRIRVDFYERFRTICAARGLVRNESQTQREFARQVNDSLNDLLAASGLRELPTDLVDSFYQVRFGKDPIDAKQAEDIDRRLTRLEEALTVS